MLAGGGERAKKKKRREANKNDALCGFRKPFD
jgi:hypothetical protein